MKKTLLIALLTLFGACTTTSNARLNLDRRGVALEGYDPVSYHRPTGPVKGRPEHSAAHAGATYWFADQASRTRFLRSPDYYEPLYGGWCAYAMIEGDKVEVDPTCYMLTSRGLFLFYKSVLIDTRERWQRADHDQQKAQADRHWSELERERALAPQPSS